MAARQAGRNPPRGSARQGARQPAFRRPYLLAALAAAIAVAAIVWWLARPTTTLTPLAPAPGYAGHPRIDEIPCETTEQVRYHVHAHLAIVVNGQPRSVPEGIGIAPPRQIDNSGGSPFVVSGACFYWLHTHTGDGVIHVESPAVRAFTLGQFFDVWQQPLGADQVGLARGPVVAYLNGQPYQGNPRDIPLAAHAVIQLDVSQNVPPASYTFAPGL